MVLRKTKTQRTKTVQRGIKMSVSTLNMINEYAANINNSPKVYDSITTGMAIIKFRGERSAYYDSKGYDYYTKVDAIAKDVLITFGSPKHY
jgi:hypothetical protein